jgi:hypothetical protein
MRGVVVVAIVLGFGVAWAEGPKAEPPPVILDLGPVQPTPAPTPEPATRRRLITSITIQNGASGETIVNFEATDVADEGKGKFHTIASARYSLSDDRAKLKPLSKKILEQIRVLERDMLDFAEVAGPPKARPPLLSEPDSGSQPSMR